MPDKRRDVPSWRQMEVSSDSKLSKKEKEVRIVGANDQDELRISTEIPTIIKWVQSVEASSLEWARVGEESDGSEYICAVTAKIPKGIMKLQATPRKSNQHSQIVSYGQLRD